MVVSPELDYFECFECGRKGNAGDFVMELRKVRFPRPRYGRGTVDGDEVTGTVYVLELAEGRYYIGFTREYQKRIQCHFSGKGADYTRQFTPVRVLTAHHDVPIRFENELTEIYIGQYGWQNVRGGDYAYLSEIKDIKRGRPKKPKSGAYLLRCYKGYFYVGFAADMEADVQLQMNGGGCEWTRLHQPYKVVKRVRTDDPEMARKLTLETMKRYSWRRVRGAEWQELEIQRPEELANPAIDKLLAGNYYIS